MNVDAASLYPPLTVIDGRLTIDARRDEAHIEAIAFCEEAIAATARIVNAITGLPVPSMTVINEATRLAYRAEFARAELIALAGALPDGDAA